MPCWVVYQETSDKSALDTKSAPTSGRPSAAAPPLDAGTGGILTS
jgi:hypothetical protein